MIRGFNAQCRLLLVGYAFRHVDVVNMKFKLAIMGKKGDISDWVVVDTGQTGLTSSGTADPLVFLCTTIYKIYREWSAQEKLSGEWQSSGQKCLADARDQWRMARLELKGNSFSNNCLLQPSDAEEHL